MARRLSPEIEAGIARASRSTGLPPETLRAFVLIESGGRPDVQTGSYRGLLQLSPGEFARHGGQGDIFDIDQNLTAGAAKLKAESADFARRYGREPNASELYLMHQQGVGGSAKHWENPDRPAWQNMLDTGEGRQKGEDWAKAAIWGNVPDDVKRQYGSVDNLTSRDFTKLWDQKVARFSGQPVDAQPTLVADAGKTPAASPPAATAPFGVAEAPQVKTPASAAPTSMASLFGLNVPMTGFGGQPLAPAPAAPSAAPIQTAFASTPGVTTSPTADLTSAITGGGINLGPFSLGGASGGNSAAESADAEEAAAPQVPQLDLGGKPVDMQRLLAVLNNRSKLGLA